MENDGLDDVFAVADSAATEEAATEAVVPAEDAAPTEVIESPVVADASELAPSQGSVPAADTPAPVTETALAEPVAPPVQAPVIDWEHPELKSVREKAQAHDSLMKGIEEAKRLKANREFQDRMNDLADGDPERLQQINGLVANATTPLVGQLSEYEQQLHGTQKEFAAWIVAARAVLPDETFNRIAEEMAPLLTVEGAEAMESIALGKKQLISSYETKLATSDKRIKELELQIAAGAQLSERGNADLVDSGGGLPAGGNRREQLANAKTEDEYFDRLWGIAS